MGRTLVFGDIHGGLRALRQLIERASVTSRDTLIFLGDYVDSWSESPQVLDYLMFLETKYTCVFMRGNHDDLLLEWLGGKDNELWFQHGGESTIIAYSKLTDEDRDRHVGFLSRLRTFYIDDKNKLYVHAGFTNQHGIEKEYFPRMVFWDRTLWEMALAMDRNLKQGDENYPKRLTHYKEIYIGHTPTTKSNQTTPMNIANIWNIDTGAAFYGPLTCIDAHSKEFWQSDALPDLYPAERGRN